METDVTVVLAVPVLVNVIWPSGFGAVPAPCTANPVPAQAVEGLAGRFTTDARTLAVLVNDPKRPKTNPATAMAAINVIAISMTVARTGLMALRLFVAWQRSIFSLYWKFPV